MAFLTRAVRQRGHPREDGAGVVASPNRMPGRADRNEKLLESGLVLASELSLEAVLERIVELAVDLTGARYGALGVLGPDGEIARFVTKGVTPEQRRAIGHPPIGRGVLGVLIEEPKPLRLPEVSRHPQSVGFPKNHPPMKSFLGAPVTARGRVFGNIYLTEKQGAEEFDDEDERALVILAGQAGVAVETARLLEETRQRERRLDAVREIATEILEGAESEDVLSLVARRARELVGADLSTIAIGSGHDLVLAVADGERADSLAGTTFPTEGSASGEVIVTGKPLVLEDASADPRAYQPVMRLGGIGPAMFVPLKAGERAFGTLAVCNTQGGRVFNDDDLTLVETFADQASVALEYARVQGELRRLAILGDRERIAKELHDGVIQSLFAVGMGLQAAATVSRDADTEERLEGAVGEIDRAIRDLRNYIFGLRPGILADRQLDQALRTLAEDFETRSGVVTAVHIDPDLAAQLSSNAGHVVQLAREALSNVGRHAAASTCRLALTREDGVAVLEVDDDGMGFQPAAEHGPGQGLRNLRERAASLGGAVDIDSTPGQGTTVRVTIPL
jgi:two-component system, NarL family, sensor histidine kinase DevS